MLVLLRTLAFQRVVKSLRFRAERTKRRKQLIAARTIVKYVCSAVLELLMLFDRSESVSLQMPRFDDVSLIL